ncbi:hypothetical protein K439DRAFT_1611685 [Ramaria rubella]|nr:hypothetical protein K439DRAFT_1611685 [Ramaria rubella]
MASFSSPEPTFHASLTARKAKAFRAWAFPNEVNQELHTAYLSLEHIEDWLQHDTYQLFVWSKQQLPGGSHSGIGESFVADSPIGRLKAYRDMQHEYWSLENAEVWIKWVPFEAYLEWFRTVHPNQLSGSFTVGPAKAAKAHFLHPARPLVFPQAQCIPLSITCHQTMTKTSHPHRDHFHRNEAVALCFVNSGSSDDFKVFEQELHAKCRSTIAQSAGHLDSPIIISSDPPELTHPCKKRKAITLNKGIWLTTKKTVAKIERLTTIPKVWAVPWDNTAYLFDLSEDPDKLCKPDGMTRTIDSLIHMEDHESWAGSSGSKRGNTWVQNALGDAPDGVILDCERFEPDENECQNIWDAAKVQNQKEAEDVNAIVAWLCWWASDENTKEDMCLSCKPACLLLLMSYLTGSKGISKEGQMYFIGCSQWKHGEDGLNHLYVSIPANVDESELKLAMETGHLRESVTVNPMCTFNVHPHVGNKKLSHVIDGKIVHAQINKERKCPTWLTVFVPVDPTIHKAVLIFCKPHNHPMHLMDKATPDQRVLLEKVMNVAAPSTYAALYGNTLGESCPGFVNSQQLRDAIKEIHECDYPKGFGWEGLQLECICDASLPPEKCYIHSVVFRGQVHVAVTMHPAIGKYIHNVPYLAIDNTFKQVAGFLETLGKCLIFASIYSNSSTCEAFWLLWREFLEVVKNVTGKELKILVIHKDGALWCIIVDAEPAQIQGLGDVLLMLNVPTISGIHTTDPLEIILYLIMTCCTHFVRNVEGLSKDVPHEEIKHLKSFMGLKSHHEIAEWHQQCIASPYKAMKDWYQNKIMHPWYLPSVNAFLSKIPEDSWKITPNHNLVKSAHAGQNADTPDQCECTYCSLMLMIIRLLQNWPIAKRQGIWKTCKMGFLSVNDVQYNATLVERYLSLDVEQHEDAAIKKASLQHQKEIDTWLKELHTVHPTQRSVEAHEEIEKLEHERHEAKEKRNAWDDHQRITQEMSELRSGELKNVRLKGTHPIAKPLEFTASANNKENAPSAGIRNLSIKPNVVDNVSLSDPPLNDSHHIPQDAISHPLHPTFAEISFDVHKQLHSPNAVASSSATTLDTFVAFEESHFNELAEFFADPSVMKLMEGGDYQN